MTKIGKDYSGTTTKSDDLRILRPFFKVVYVVNQALSAYCPQPLSNSSAFYPGFVGEMILVTGRPGPKGS